jgi:hypothetical protein
MILPPLRGEKRMTSVGASFSPPLRGGVDATSIKYSEAPFYGADGVVSKFRRICLWLTTTPSARLRMLRGFFLIAQPPLLGELGEEGNGGMAHRHDNSGPQY